MRRVSILLCDRAYSIAHPHDPRITVQDVDIGLAVKTPGDAKLHHMGKNVHNSPTHFWYIKTSKQRSSRLL